MGQADFARLRPAPADQVGMADRVMGRAKRACADQWLTFTEHIGHRVDARDVQRIADRQLG